MREEELFLRELGDRNLFLTDSFVSVKNSLFLTLE